MTFRIHCSQRGCESTAKTAPKLCPVCKNPLLSGDAQDESKNAPPDSTTDQPQENQDGNEETPPSA